MTKTIRFGDSLNYFYETKDGNKEVSYNGEAEINVLNGDMTDIELKNRIKRVYAIGINTYGLDFFGKTIEQNQLFKHIAGGDFTVEKVKIAGGFFDKYKTLTEFTDDKNLVYIQKTYLDRVELSDIVNLEPMDFTQKM